ncbi:MAG: signal peptidase I [Patescibacteria group bacterium]|nr:signal peptidase I [Patescibacteria group bacterium]
MFKKSYNFLRYIGFGFVIFIVALVLFRLFVLEPFVVRGASMEPNFREGDYLWIEKVSKYFSDFQRGEVVVLDAPDNPGQVYIKRIIGLPGERIIVKKNGIYINKEFDSFKLDETYVQAGMTYNRQEDVTLEKDEIFVMGDNRNVSEDSRYFGPIKVKAIVGRALFRLLPFDQKGLIQIPDIILQESTLTY